MDACLWRTVLICVRVCDEQTAVDTHRSLESYLLLGINLRLEIIACRFHPFIGHKGP
jgi:hypothetical protein